MQETIQRLKKLNFATVCQSANYPNMSECWSSGTATIMVMGDTCTRACKFCNVKTGMPDKLDLLEPQKTAFAIKQMDIDYVVITSVDRDELPDQGANHLKKVIEMVRRFNPNIKIEILAPDFRGKIELLKIALAAKPEVYAHNIETVKRLTPKVRDIRATYQNSLNILKQAKEISRKI